jgi:lanosterol synthase
MEDPPPELLSKLSVAYQYLSAMQITVPLAPLPVDRENVLGGWCFGDCAQQWPASDCTAEALCAILDAHNHPTLIPYGCRISENRLQQAVLFILSRQNRDGGFSSLESQRAGAWLEYFNSSQMFGNSCMRERSYVECTASCLKALCRFHALYPHYNPATLQTAIKRAYHFLLRAQKPDGSFQGFWGINSTYAAFFVAEGLAAALGPEHISLQRLADWLFGAQLSDGGWGEHYSSCYLKRYVPLNQSRVAMTAWAILTLSLLGNGSDSRVYRAVCWLQDKQTDNGSWPNDGASGAFFESTSIDYRLYNNYFALWALIRHQRSLALPPFASLCHRRFHFR